MKWDAPYDLYGSVISDVLLRGALPTTSTNLALTYNPFIVLVTRRVQSMPLGGQGVMANDILEYDLLANHTELSNILETFFKENNSASIGHEQEQFVGGNFFSNIVGHVKKALPHVANTVRAIHTLSGLASSGLSALGQGRSKRR